MSNNTEREYNVNFYSETLRNQMNLRLPKIMTVDHQYIESRNGEHVHKVNIFFGGVPKKNLHESLEKAGFVLRHRAFEWKLKKQNGKTAKVTDSNRNCFAAYYSKGSELTSAQLMMLTKLASLTSEAIKKGTTFLCPSWDEIEASWGSKQAWINTLCPNQSSPAPAQTTKKTKKQKAAPKKTEEQPADNSSSSDEEETPSNMLSGGDDEDFSLVIMEYRS